jgi:hypothetical protein
VSRDCPDHGWECTGLGHEGNLKVNETGNVTKAMEADKGEEQESKVEEALVEITIRMKYEFDPSNYEKGYDKDGNEVDLDAEQQAALTKEDMLRIDKLYIVKGNYSLSEFLDYGDYNGEDDVTFKLVEDSDGGQP